MVEISTAPHIAEQAHAGRVLAIDPCTHRVWANLVERRNSDVFHSPAWLRVLGDSYGFEIAAYVLVDADGQPIAGLPFAHVRDALGERIVTLPFSDYCDPLVDDLVQWRLLASHLLTAGCSVMVRCLHGDAPLSDHRFRLANRARWHGVQLDADIDEIWMRLDSSARRAINKARREDVTVEVATDGAALRAFYDLHLGIRKNKYRMLAQPYRFFEHIGEHMLAAGAGFTIIARHDGRVAAAAVFLRWRDRLYYKFSASDPAMQLLRPTDVILWEAVARAKEAGCTLLDLGLCDWDQEGLRSFKLKYASVEKTISFLRSDRAGTTDYRAAEMRALLPQLTDLFTAPTIPDEITERAGDLLYRFFV